MCEGGHWTQNPDGGAVCTGQVVVQTVDPLSALTAGQVSTLTSAVVLCLATAFVFKMLRLAVWSKSA